MPDRVDAVVMPTKLHPGVFDITLSDDEKRYRAFLLTGETTTLVDCGLPDTTEALFRGIDAVGTDPDRLIITHADPDHIGGFDAVVDRYGMETYVPDQSVIETATDPDHRFGHEDRIGRFQAVHVPGHEPDNYVLVDEDEGIAIMGDALSGSDQRGLPAGYFVLPPAVYSQDLNAAEANLERVLTYEFDVGLVYHGSSVMEGASRKIERFVHFPGRP